LTRELGQREGRELGSLQRAENVAEGGVG